jgi:hypothetical protein
MLLAEAKVLLPPGLAGEKWIFIDLLPETAIKS